MLASTESAHTVNVVLAVDDVLHKRVLQTSESSSFTPYPAVVQTVIAFVAFRLDDWNTETVLRLL